MINYILMQIVPQKITTSCSTMSVINCKKSWLNSIFINIQNYTYPILIIISCYSLMGIYCIRFNNSILFWRILWLINFWKLFIGQTLILLFLSKFIICFNLMNSCFLELSSSKSFRQNLIFSIFTNPRVNCTNLTLFTWLLIHVNNTLLSLITSKSRRHIYWSIRRSNLKLL
jgi:hypothetical protein